MAGASGLRSIELFRGKLFLLVSRDVVTSSVCIRETKEEWKFREVEFTNYNFKIGRCFGLHTTAIREIGIKTGGRLRLRAVCTRPTQFPGNAAKTKQNKTNKQQKPRVVLKYEHSIAGRYLKISTYK